jgi:hypothetical protein
MKNKAILVSIIALFAIVLTLNAVIASEVDVTINDVVVNDVSLMSLTTAAGFVSNNVPVEIEFRSNADLEDVRVKVYIEGYKDEIYESTSRFNTFNGSTYLKRFSLELPSSMDLDNNPEDLTLLVRISAKGQDTFEQEYSIRMQRDTYSLEFLSIDADEKIAAGSVLALDIVLKNNGFDRLDDTYVRASIPELGISQRVYFGDISSDSDEDYDEIRDSLNKRIYLAIPADAVSGIYNIEVEAYNYDASITANKKVTINGVAKEDTEDTDKDDVKDVEDADKTATSNNTVLILTVILAIIFVVLLVVLIVLLAKKPAETEEFGETSYY